MLLYHTTYVLVLVSKKDGDISDFYKKWKHFSKVMKTLQKKNIYIYIHMCVCKKTAGNPTIPDLERESLEILRLDHGSLLTCCP